MLKQYFYTLVYFWVLVFSFVLPDYYYQMVYVLMAVSIIALLDKMGKGLVLRESIAVFYVLTCALMPILGYEVYNFDNAFSRLWKNYMRVPSTQYFSFVLPAVSAFCLALTWPFKGRKYSDEGPWLMALIEKCREILSRDRKLSFLLIVVGLCSFFIVRALPAALQYVATIVFLCSFTGLLYLNFQPDFKGKLLWLLAFIGFFVLNAMSIGMFTIVAYMGITIFSFFLLGTKASLARKVLVFLAILFLVTVLQQTKVTYRKYTWAKGVEGDAGLFFGIFVDNIQRGDALFEKRTFFPVHTRINQGFYISLVMKRIPRVKEFDNGAALFTAIGSSFVPRLLWPDKPEAGGRFNMLYYAGWPLKGYSANVGPLGEAYGSFGKFGGIVYMFFLGLFIRWVLGRVLLLSRKIPLLVCWIPVLFFQVIYSAEADTMQILNSVIKSAFFIWMIYLFLPRWLGRYDFSRHIQRLNSSPDNLNISSKNLVSAD